MNLLKAEMVKKNFTQNDMARELGISVQNFNAKINGRSQFKLSEVEKIVNILNIVNVTEIFFNITVPNKQQTNNNNTQNKG